jgi:hypothetical protein
MLPMTIINSTTTTRRQPTARELKASRIASQGMARPLTNSVWTVRSQSRPSVRYTVNLDAKTCDCQDHARGFACKHYLAARAMDRALAAVGKYQANDNLEQLVGAVITLETQVDQGFQGAGEFEANNAAIMRLALTWGTSQQVQVAA